MNNKIYISSKMSGLPNYNFEGFNRVEETLKKGGLDVWNPAKHEPNKKDAMWSEYLADDIIDIETNCDSILMFGQWYRSVGAVIELLTAHRLGLKIYIEQWWLKFVPKLLNIVFKTTGSSKSTLTE